jgi:cytochrome c oxidase subunit 3
VLAGSSWSASKAQCAHHFDIGEGPWHNAFLAIYFTMTGLPACYHRRDDRDGVFHQPGREDVEDASRAVLDRIEATGLCWHFVDLVWIFLFPGVMHFSRRTGPVFRRSGPWESRKCTLTHLK